MRIIITLLLVVFLSSCGKKEARRPVMIKTDTFLKESAKKNREILEDQQSVMDLSIIMLLKIRKRLTNLLLEMW